MTALCINLDGATERWQLMQTQELPGDVAPLRRVEAVRGASLDPRDPALPLSLACRVRLLEQRRICNGAYIDGLGALGCTLSHVRCWEHLLALPPSVPYALVLEDDCCLEPGFASVWAREVRPVLLRGDVDWIILGYHEVPRHGFWDPPRWRPDRLGHRIHAFYGSHCYVVTRRGALRLLGLVFPVQLHIDNFLSALLQVGAAPEAFVWPRSLARQCRWYLPKDIHHFGWSVNYKRVLPDLDTAWCLAVTLLLVLSSVALAVWRNKT